MARSPDKAGPPDDDQRPEYDFRAHRGVVRGRYAARLRLVRLAADVAAAFAADDAVNEALRQYLRDHPSEQSPV